MKTYAFSHAGYCRRKNEDHYLIKQMHGGMNLLAVADGMCGDAPGEQAAQITKDMLAEVKLGAWGNDFRLSYLVKKIDRIIHGQTQIDNSLKGMGTTITAVFLRGSVANWVHVGDSRFYLLRDRKLFQVTADFNRNRLSGETAVPEENAGLADPAFIRCPCVGFGGCEPTTGSLTLKRGDLLLLVTDGFHEIMPAETISSLLNTNKALESKAMDLSQALLDIGCKDDATVVMAEL